MNNNSPNETNQKLLQTLLLKIKEKEKTIKSQEVQLIKGAEKYKQSQRLIYFLIFILILSGISNMLCLLH